MCVSLCFFMANLHGEKFLKAFYIKFYLETGFYKYSLLFSENFNLSIIYKKVYSLFLFYNICGYFSLGG